METQQKPDPQFIAQQLRKPSGEAAGNIAAKMDQVNGPLFDLTLHTMQLRDKEKVLEIGFGSGTFFEKVFNSAKGLEVHGIDYSPEMVAMAQSNNPELIKSGKLTLSNGQSDHLLYADHAFDKVFCNMVVFFWENPEEHLREIYRVLKPGGRFYTGFRPTESMRQFPFIDYGFTLYDPQEWIELIKNCGFNYVDMTKQPDPLIKEEDHDILLESVCVVGEKE